MNGVADPTAGWYGKLPSLGDFASRRLPAGFIEPWDAWLSGVLDASRRRLGADWLNAYLACPVWRFMLLPGTLATEGCWAGVLMASVDRVGRHFPLTVAAQVAGPPATPEALRGTWDWLSALERCALDAIEFDYDIDAFDASLARVAPPPPPGPPSPWQALLAGRSLWTSVSPDPQLPFDVHTEAGLPEIAGFSLLLTGR